MLSESKYDADCTALREKHKADAVVILVLAGEGRSGIACQFESLLAMKVLAEAVKKMGAAMEEDIADLEKRRLEAGG